MCTWTGFYVVLVLLFNKLNKIFYMFILYLNRSDVFNCEKFYFVNLTLVVQHFHSLFNTPSLSNL